ncbi:hypothetical protein [Georgenia sp. AZ-5]|uniref:hypothetical protein n=1 Tax=Georgenia sp. AZ-5 TaxID=3367526 RepID=UPI003754CB3F
MSTTAVPLIDKQLNIKCHVLGHHWHDERIGFSNLYLTACMRCGEVEHEASSLTRTS